MARKQNPAQILQRKLSTLADVLQGRERANSSTLSASYDLPIEEVRKALRQRGVIDDG